MFSEINLVTNYCFFFNLRSHTKRKYSKKFRNQTLLIIIDLIKYFDYLYFELYLPSLLVCYFYYISHQCWYGKSRNFCYLTL